MYLSRVLHYRPDPPKRRNAPLDVLVGDRARLPLGRQVVLEDDALQLLQAGVVADGAGPGEGELDAVVLRRVVAGREHGARRVEAAGHDIGAAWKKTSEAGRDYLSVTLYDPSFPATVYARLIESENGTHDLIWSRSKPQAA